MDRGTRHRGRTPRGRWVEEALRALGARGPDGVRVEALAKALGVTKGGFYWHFDGRDALVGEMLDTWERTVVDDAIALVEREEGDARAKLERLFALPFRGDILKVELAVRDWARRDAAVAERLARVDNRRMDYMRSLFAALSDDDEEVEARCLLALTLFVGTHFVAADHGPRSRGHVVGRRSSCCWTDYSTKPAPGGSRRRRPRASPCRW